MNNIRNQINPIKIKYLIIEKPDKAKLKSKSQKKNN